MGGIKMTISEAIRLLDPSTSAQAIKEIEYYGGFNGREKVLAAINEACKMACDIMRQYDDDMK